MLDKTMGWIVVVRLVPKQGLLLFALIDSLSSVRLMCLVSFLFLSFKYIKLILICCTYKCLFKCIITRICAYINFVKFEVRWPNQKLLY